MAATAQTSGFGFKLARQPTVHGIARRFPIATGYGYDIFSGDPVSLAGTITAEGTIELSTLDGTRTGTIAAMPILGIFAGCEYTDSTGKPVKSSYWPASTAQLTDTIAWALVYEGDQNEFEVLSNGAIPVTDIGTQADWVNGASPYGSTYTGRATAMISGTTVADASSGGFQILDFIEDGANTAGDASTRVIVRIANPQLGRAARVVENDAGTA
jgi:hypothetical protein